MHGCVELNHEVGLTLKLVLIFEDLNDLSWEIPISIGLDIVLIGVLTHFKVKLDALNVFEFLFVLTHITRDEPMFMKFFLDTCSDKDVDSLMYFGVGVIVMELLLKTLFGHLSCELYRSHVGKPLYLGFFSLENHLIQLYFSHVVRFMNDQFGAEIVCGEQEVILVDHFYYLVLIKTWYKLYQKVLVILQNHYPKFLKHML